MCVGPDLPPPVPFANTYVIPSQILCTLTFFCRRQLYEDAVQALSTLRITLTLRPSECSIVTEIVHTQIRISNMFSQGLDTPMAYRGNAAVLVQWYIGRIVRFIVLNPFNHCLPKLMPIHSAMNLFMSDPTMHIALECAKALAGPFETLLCIWPSPCVYMLINEKLFLVPYLFLLILDHRKRWGTMRAQLVEMCLATGVEPPAVALPSPFGNFNREFVN